MQEMNMHFASTVRKFLSEYSKISLSEDEMKEFINIYMLMRKKLSMEDYIYKKEAIVGYLTILVCDCCQFMETHSPGKSIQNSRNMQIYERFMAEVKQHYTGERSIKFYADRLFITPKYLSRVVRKASGKLAGEWIRDFVVLEAKALLKSRQYSIQQISDMLNFPNQSTFGVYFKKAVGSSPKSYREQ